MNATDIGLIVLRVVGLLWTVGALVLFWHLWRMRSIDRLAQELQRVVATMEEHAPGASAGIDPVDRGRTAWMAVGGVCLLAAGALMALAHAYVIIALGVLIVQQLAYFIRQRQLELRAKTDDGAEDARPARSTINAFFFSLVMAVLAGWLYRQGALAGGFG